MLKRPAIELGLISDINMHLYLGIYYIGIYYIAKDTVKQIINI